MNQYAAILTAILRGIVCLTFVFGALGIRYVQAPVHMDCCDEPTITSCCMGTSACCFESPQNLPSKVSLPLVSSHPTDACTAVDFEARYRSTGFSQIRPKPPPDLVSTDRQALLSSFLI